MIDIGQKVIIRTVTNYYTGCVVQIDDHWIKLEDAAWIADTGRWNNALVSGELSEVEPYPNACLVARAAIVDLCAWVHDLPRDVK